jgi:transposase
LGKTLLFTDRTGWSDEQIVLAYRAQHHIEADFRRLKDPHYLIFRPAFHWTDQKLRVHAFYCVLALLLLNLLRRKLAKAGIPLSVAKMMDTLTDIREVTLLYSGASGSQKPLARTVLADMTPNQCKIVETLGLERYRSS